MRAPEGDLSAFPRTLPPPVLYRLAFHRDPTGAVTGPWRFGSVPPGANRFDLPVPHGTCSWSDRRYGALVQAKGKHYQLEDLVGFLGRRANHHDHVAAVVAAQNRQGIDRRVGREQVMQDVA